MSSQNQTRLPEYKIHRTDCSPMPDLQWPATRNFPFPEPGPQSTLSEAWAWSKRQLNAISTTIADSRLPAEIACIAVSGSLSRMEAHQRSDVDVLVVYDDVRHCYCSEHAAQLWNRVWNTIQQTEGFVALKRPKPNGVFSTVARLSSLTNPDVRGVIDEDMLHYGQRMQLLLDAQPVYQADQFALLQQQLLRWYSEDHIWQTFQESGPFHWLSQDVHRYWRSIRSRACWLYTDEPQKALEVNLKLRSSRLAIIAAMLLAIERGHQHHTLNSTIETLQTQLTLTPLERLFSGLNHETAVDLMTAYQTIWTEIRDLQKSSQSPSPVVLIAIRKFRKTLLSSHPECMDWVL